METDHPSTRVVNSGSGNRALVRNKREFTYSLRLSWTLIVETHTGSPYKREIIILELKTMFCRIYMTAALKRTLSQDHGHLQTSPDRPLTIRRRRRFESRVMYFCIHRPNRLLSEVQLVSRVTDERLVILTFHSKRLCIPKFSKRTKRALIRANISPSTAKKINI